MTNLFKKKMIIQDKCLDNNAARFIEKGMMSTDIKLLKSNKTIKAAIVTNHKEGPDSIIVYTMKTEDTEKTLTKADFFKKDNVVYFVYNDIKETYNTSFIKQFAYECNVSFSIGEDTKYGYYVSKLNSNMGEEFASRLAVLSNEKPVIVLPDEEWIKIGINIRISDKSFRILDIDDITNKGVAYVSLQRSFYIEESSIEQEDQEDDQEDQENQENENLKAGIEYEWDIINGYFTATPAVNITNKTLTKITFIIPFGIDFVEIGVKNEEEEIIKTIYGVE